MRLLLTGAGGFVGRHLWAALKRHEVYGSLSPPPYRVRPDLETPGAAARLVTALRPHGVIHAAAMATIAACEAEPNRARRVNTAATLELAAAARRVGARFLFFSTDQVFDGRGAPYDEDAAPCPLHVYGRTKRDAERGLGEVHPEAVVLRLALVYGDHPRSPTEAVFRAARTGEPARLFVDEFRTPVAAPFVAAVTAKLLRTDFAGILHVGGAERVSRYDFGRRVCAVLGLSTGVLEPVRARELRLRPPRPADLTLRTERLRDITGLCPPPLTASLRALFARRG